MAHVAQLPSGSWRVTVAAGGHRRTGTAPTKREANRLGATLLTALETEIGPRRRRRNTTTVADLLDRHIAANEHRWSPSTLAEIRRARLRVPDHLAERRADDIGPLDLADVWTDLARTVAPGGVARIHELISAAYTQAMRLEVVRVNPAASARPPTATKPRPTPPDPATVVAILARLDDTPKFAAFVRLAATSGARRGELVALRWGDIDLTDGRVTIGRAAVWTKASGLVVKGTKTGGVRHVALDSATVACLRRLREWRAEHEHLLTVAADSYVFGFVDRPIRPDWATQRWVRFRADMVADERARARLERRKPDPVIVAAGTVRLHDLRHYSASRLIAAGVDPVTVAGRLGHSTPQTTLRVYAHFLPERDRAAADVLAAELG